LKFVFDFSGILEKLLEIPGTFGTFGIS